MVRIAIVEDEPAIGKLVKMALQKEEFDIQLYISASEALEKIQGAGVPDIILMDVSLPGLSGVELTRILKERYPRLEVIIYTVFADNGTILNAIKAGASGYLLKSAPIEEIKEALRIVQNGGSFLTGEVARKVLQEFCKPKDPESGAGLRDCGKKFNLSSKEEEVLSEFIRGRSSKEVAAKYCISIHTVNAHTRKIFEKMQVNSRAEAVAKAINKTSPLF